MFYHLIVMFYIEFCQKCVIYITILDIYIHMISEQYLLYWTQPGAKICRTVKAVARPLLRTCNVGVFYDL